MGCPMGEGGSMDELDYLAGYLGCPAGEGP